MAISSGGYPDDFLDQLLVVPPQYSNEDSSSNGLQMKLSGESSNQRNSHGGVFDTSQPPSLLLGLSLEQGFANGGNVPWEHNALINGISANAGTQRKRQHYPAPAALSTPYAGPRIAAVRPRVRARRGQATDPHSIAERLRRERISERMKALQELVPLCNKTDRAAMLDEIVDYVKFLKLQVKVLNMGRLEKSISGEQPKGELLDYVKKEANGEESRIREWDKWFKDGTEQHVAKLMDQDVGAAMQFLQSKALCIMPISLAITLYGSNVCPVVMP